MKELDRILAESAAQIEAPYFLLPIDGGDSVYRERVYCYELYHQMRSAWPRQCRYSLNGEVDKRAHAGLKALGVGALKPDLLVHTPGDMGGNHAVIEVKPATAKSAGLKKDLSTLALFQNRPHYERAILLVYGNRDADRLKKTIARLAEGIEGANGIELWVHPDVRQPAINLGAVETL